MQYRKGTFTSTGAAVNLKLGFVPDKFRIFNYTISAQTIASGVVESLYIKGATPAAGAYSTTKALTTGALTAAPVTTNGFTAVVDGGDWQNTIYTISTISSASPGVVTVVSAQPTNSLALVNGMVFTMSGVVGLKNVNSQRFVVAGLSGTTFNLYDQFGNPVDTTVLGTHTANTGQMDVISYPPTAPVLDATTGQVITPGSPAGLQYDIGYQGLTLGTSVVGSTGNVMYWEAFLETPTGY